MASPYSALRSLQGSRDGRSYDTDAVQGLDSTGGPLLARYDLDQVARSTDRAAIAARGPSLWRYHELLPVRDERNVVTFGEGMTPLQPAPRYGARVGLPHLLVKDESPMPTGSFKARGAAVGVSRARELGVRGIAMPTNGNAGAAWAAYAARAGMAALVAMPVDAPEITRRECVAAGAETVLIDGLISDAGAWIKEELTRRPGMQNVATLTEPYRVEGKKTMGLEIVEQLGWRSPDVILYPTGGGVGIIGIHKALLELRELGWLTGELPRLVAVQATGCSPVVDAFVAGREDTVAPSDPHTVAFGITVPTPLGDRLVLRAVRDTGGTALAVSDEDLLAAQHAFARDEGLWMCPEGAACLTAAAQLRESGWLSSSEQVVVLNTGTGLIYPDTVSADLRVARPS